MYPFNQRRQSAHVNQRSVAQQETHQKKKNIYTKKAQTKPKQSERILNTAGVQAANTSEQPTNELTEFQSQIKPVRCS